MLIIYYYAIYIVLKADEVHIHVCLNGCVINDRYTYI